MSVQLEALDILGDLLSRFGGNVSILHVDKKIVDGVCSAHFICKVLS